MKKTLFVALCTLLAMPLLAADSFTMPDWKADFAKHWAVSRDLTIAVADAMPAGDYGFIPNPELKPVEMSYAQLMIHIAQANAGACARVSGQTAPAKPDSMDKAAAMKFLNESYDFCGKAIDAITDEQLVKMAGPEGHQMAGHDVLWSYFTHTAHHRGQAEVYLRLKNIKPPTYKF
ncbi:MAG: DinB family protein [Acidobacteriota bacterium]|nr:DinB family protein [Acidobacteriota bacterium]